MVKPHICNISICFLFSIARCSSFIISLSGANFACFNFAAYISQENLLSSVAIMI